MEEQNIIQKTQQYIRNSVSFKIFTIFILVLILLIPASMVSSLIYERQTRKTEVVDEISSKWGNEQTISGPVISIPYKRYFEDKDGKRKYTRHYMHFLPDDLSVEGTLNPHIRYRGIYQAVLYNAEITLKGRFPKLPVQEMNIPEENINWGGAYISLGISDMRGIKEQIDAKINKTPLEMNPGIESNDVIASGVSARMPLQPYSGETTFEFSLNLNGSYRIQFVPVGRATTVALTSSWASPSFDGAFLPVNRDITPEGFKANWKVLHLNRNYPQHWTGNKHQIGGSAFGVKLFVAVDIYQKATRTAKYAIMFIAFTFMAFFFSEVMNRDRLHPIQYLLIGLAITIFYTLLLSISEHLNFDGAYLISSLAIIGLVTAYAKSILKNRNMSFMVCGILVILYAYLYLVLQQEDYALLMGSIGLFVVLALVMYFTRKIDWYNLNLDAPSKASPGNEKGEDLKWDLK